MTGGVESFGTASASKHDFVRQRGLTHPIDYHSRDYEEEVRRLTNGRGVDLILDPIGGDSWRKGLRLLAPTGRLVCFGMSSANQSKERSIIGGLKAIASIPWLKVNPISLMNENKGVFGVNVGHMWDEVDRLTGWLDRILGWWAEGRSGLTSTGRSRSRRPRRRTRTSRSAATWARCCSCRDGPSSTRGHGNYFLTVTLLMTTGSTGTSWCMPLLPVETFSIFSTTSMPEITLPKTA